MTRIWRKVAFALSIVTVLAATAMPSLGAVRSKNTSTYVGHGRWDWTIFIEADEATLRKIECVEYTLHRTFRNPIRRVCNKPETKFAYSTNGWGTFTVLVKVQYKDRREEVIRHPLVFKESKAPASLNVTPDNWSRQIEPGWWAWGIYIKGTPFQLNLIRCVEYTLHRTFQKPVRLVCSLPRFELTTRGWGTFTVKIKLLLKDGTTHRLSHPLKFQ